MKVTLARALKMKNRLITEMQDISIEVKAYNVFTKGKQPDVDTKAKFAELRDMADLLVDLKTTIVLANSPIQAKLNRMGELKNQIAVLKGTDTDRGIYKSGAGRIGRLWEDKSNDAEYIASMNYEYVSNLISELRKEVDELQDELDAFNAVTEIEVNDRLS